MLGPVPFSSHKDKIVSNINAKRSDLTVSFSQWKAKLGGVADPIKEKVQQTTFQVFGIWDTVYSDGRMGRAGWIGGITVSDWHTDVLG
ncbi:hypothetical protein CALVIDRAFT_567878 [Calocera viscosa TUFC12733]|uniref:Uncharacterized protein n=1 Tax=Calocera viscosa (strain TUFC12733) TaxID=1330018 RepID=A0A167HPU4_CALVF|nr:hypothetical protein CALVIDRAFT_567878 [Calocera viscosa TUFC12733]